MIDACRYCGGDPQGEFEAREMMFGWRDRFTYSRCSRCGSLWLQEVPDDLARFYAGGYYSMTRDPRGSAPTPLARAWANVLISLPAQVAERVAGRRGFPSYLLWFSSLRPSLDSRIAEIGSGEGGIVSRLSRHGFGDVWGFDPFIEGDRDDGNAHYRRRRIGQQDGLFDIILFGHSLEHVVDPIEDLRLARAQLAPDGAIVVRTPVAGSYADQHFGRDWVGLDAPRHLSIPSASGMRYAADQLEMKLARVFYDSTPLQLWASENYQDDIPLHDQPPMDEASQQRYAAQTRELNRDGRADTAGFILTRVS